MITEESIDKLKEFLGKPREKIWDKYEVVGDMVYFYKDGFIAGCMVHEDFVKLMERVCSTPSNT